MPHTLHTLRTSARARLALAVVALLAALGAYRLLTDVEPADPVAGTGTLVVDGVTYHFSPTTCRISDEDFVAAGAGSDGDDEFWVSASSVGLDLSLGTADEQAEPADDKKWLISADGVNWEATGDTVTAEAPMIDRHSPGSTTVVGSLHVRCDEV
ncbi:MAG: hypothetical protein ACFCVK_10255 [Acidimicrobiales bacterium]